MTSHSDSPLDIIDETHPAIVCAAVEPGIQPARGSVEIHSICGHKVWLAPTGQQIVQEQSAIPVCVSCAFKEVAEGRWDPQFAPITQAQIEEIQREMIRDQLQPPI